jgi:hypothetical protein
MRIWLIGADQSGCNVLRQLRKNPEIEVIVSDATERPKAVAERLISRVDYVENVTSVNINQLARRVRPDLILIDRGAAQRVLGRGAGGVAFVEALQEEMVAASDFACLIL